MPIIILGGILSGIFTPTEAAAIGVAYGLVVGFFVTKRLSIKDLPEMLLSSAIHTGVILLIVSTAAVFSWLMATEKLPQQIANIIMSVSSNRYVVLAMINIFLLFVGCFMDQAASLIILVPILLPIAKHLDIHPIQFGIIVVTNLCIGLATPPVGNCLFVACSIADISLERISKAIWPLILVEIVVLFLITYVPAFSLSIPRLFGF
jgi:tripartite ATP-independent transporter DctM subunit